MVQKRLKSTDPEICFCKPTAQMANNDTSESNVEKKIQCVVFDIEVYCSLSFGLAFRSHENVSCFQQRIGKI